MDVKAAVAPVACGRRSPRKRLRHLALRTKMKQRVADRLFGGGANHSANHKNFAKSVTAAMSKHLQRDIDSLNTELLNISSMVEDMMD